MQLNALLGVFFCDVEPSYSPGDWAVFPTLRGDSSALPGYASVFLLIGQDAPGNWGSISVTLCHHLVGLPFVSDLKAGLVPACSWRVQFKALCHRRVQLQLPRKVTTDKRSKESEEKFWGFGDIFPTC